MSQNELTAFEVCTIHRIRFLYTVSCHVTVTKRTSIIAVLYVCPSVYHQLTGDWWKVAGNSYLSTDFP